MSRTMIVISTPFLKKKNYVQTADLRADGQYAVFLGEDPEHAKDFSTMPQACKIMEKIFNPYNRKYTAEQIVVHQSARQESSDDLL